MALLNQHFRGFTLLEMLVVISLMALVATIGLFSYEGAQDESRVDGTKFEMLELKKALLQFRADNGAFPCTVYNENDRPYELVIANMLGFTLSGISFPAGLDDSAGDAADRRAWCETNALQMLRIFPFDERDNDPSTGSYIDPVSTAHPLWNSDSKRGWRGPYLSSTDSLTDAWGNGYRLYDLELDHHPQRKYCDMKPTNVATTFTQCRSASEAGANHVVPGNVARIVSAGPDGKLGVRPAVGEDSPNAYCQSNTADANGRDDIVICLLQ